MDNEVSLTAVLLPFQHGPISPPITSPTMAQLVPCEHHDMGEAGARVGEQDEESIQLSALPQRCCPFLRHLQEIESFPNLPLTC